MNISSFALHTPVSDENLRKWTKTALRVTKSVKIALVENNTYSIFCFSSLPDRISVNREYRARRIKSESPSNKLRVCFAEFSITRNKMPAKLFLVFKIALIQISVNFYF